MSGPSGVGKDTIVNRVLALDPSLELSRSWTTRAPRPQETDADYNFVTRAEFEQHVARGGFLEWAEYVGHLYGTPLPDPTSAKDLVLVIEVQGAGQILEKVPGAVMLFVAPPSMEALAERLRRRGEDEAQIARRLEVAAGEIARGHELAHHIVINDDLDRAVAEVASILERHP